MSKELMIQNDKPIPGLEDVDRNDLVIPRFKADCKAGAFVNQLNNAMTKELNCILLTRKKGFQMWGEDSKVECRSMDRISGSKYGECAECKRFEWKEIDGEKQKPKCKATYEFLLLSDKQSIPYLMTISTPTSIGKAKKYVSSFIIDRLPLFSVKSLLTMEKKMGDNGSYYVVNFEREEKISPEEQTKLYGLMMKYNLGSKDLDVQPEKTNEFESDEILGPDDFKY